MLRWAAIGCVAVLAPTGCLQARIGIPDSSAPAEIVLDSYLRALQVADCDTAAVLSASGWASDTRRLCGLGHVTSYRIETGPGMLPNGDVSFVTTVTTGGDVIYPNGAHTMFYSLQREPDGSWRVAGGGSGP